MNRSFYGSTALKLHISDQNRKRELEEYKLKQKKLQTIYRNKLRRKSIRKEMIISILLSFIVFIFIIYGYIGPTELRVEVSKLESELHEIKGIKKDKTAEVETLKASRNIIETAKYVLGMNFSSEENYMKIDMNSTPKENVTDVGIVDKIIGKLSGLVMAKTN